MTFWKTLFYFYGFSEAGGGAAYRVGNNGLDEFIWVVIPNGIWIILPFMAMVKLWPTFVPAGPQSSFPLPDENGGIYKSEESSERYHRNGLRSNSGDATYNVQNDRKRDTRLRR